MLQENTGVWRNQFHLWELWKIIAYMMTSSNGNVFRVTGHLRGEFTGERWIPRTKPVTRSFDVFFDLRTNKRLSKQSWGWWFEPPSCSFWRHCNVGYGEDHTKGLETHICVSELGHHWFNHWPIPCLVPSHYLPHCWSRVTQTIQN